ncbi:unnamed protein product [Bursaphelenchus okinawaensis]|uniref:Glycosyltransferase family 92 protein n=1 Tax=Bursaphelenchus okinawaensis TaxID=465554 RepID=A0A811KBI2_9BILA|nr:unnamed protein product [Bursaphelenchus okinawaensis]CAG9100974.1 unnamed protein product [Bursaphelenchus okinawaensis]
MRNIFHAWISNYKNVVISILSLIILLLLYFRQPNVVYMMDKSSNKVILPFGSGKRHDMGECKPIYGKVGVFVAFRKAQYDTKYKIAQDTLHCYLKGTNYEAFFVEIFDDPEVQKHCHHEEIFFLKHCAASVYLKKVDWLLVLDADTMVANPNHCIEEYIDERVNVILYNRFFNHEIMSANYLVKNTQFGHDFLMGWADYQYKKPNSFNAADNGALHIHVLETVLPQAKPEIATCLEMWGEGKDYDEYLAYVHCVRYMLGANRLFPGKIRILKRGLGMARDGFLAVDKFCDNDFMFHGHKQNEIGEGGWESPFERPVNVSQCGAHYEGWYWRNNKRVACTEVQQHLRSFESGYDAPNVSRVIPFLDRNDVGQCWPYCDFN